MSVQQLPLMKGVGKDYLSADYIDYLPVNLLATPKEVLNAAGYLRSFPGIEKMADVDGPSRGAEYNTAQSTVYRVCGSKLYRGLSQVGSVGGRGRAAMAHSRNSQAVIVNGQVVLYRYDGTTKTISNWPVSSTYTQYELGSARDIVRVRGRYIWSKDGTDSFFISDIEDESHPDRNSAEYRAESQPDGIIGMGVWRDFVVCFGTSTTEFFTLTGATTSGAALYVNNPAYLVQKGIAGTFCKCNYLDAFAIISNPATGAPSVYLLESGQVKSIATPSIEKIIRSYSADDLALTTMGSLRIDGHELLIINLTDQTLVYDAAASQNGPQWSVLRSGLDNGAYRAVDFIYEDNVITCGDRGQGFIGRLRFDISSQYGNQQEHVLYTPLFKADNARLFDLELESSTGVAQMAERMFISATTDGINHGREQLIPWNAPFRYDQRAIWSRIGRVRKNIAFKIRIVTSSPVTLSGCQVRVE
ncbi:packaged DNA stabilization protein gp10 [Yokenella regensburgei]|uniref:packaged DNA stabilization protein n=1 Tax=Yokenella regensburgei TaxID=158877 RepID=UPI003F1637FD